GRGEAVVFELALLVFGCSLPFGANPAFALEPMERGVERTVFDLQDVVGGALDVLGDLMSMRAAEEQGAEDQHIERSLQQFDAVIGHGRYSTATGPGAIRTIAEIPA